MACLGGRGTAQTLAPHFQSLQREPAIGALAGGEPGFGATVMPSHSQAPRPKGRRKRDTAELRRFPIRNGHPECLPAVPAVPVPASNMGPGSELRVAMVQFCPPRPGESRGLAGALLLPESAKGGQLLKLRCTQGFGLAWKTAESAGFVIQEGKPSRTHPSYFPASGPFIIEEGWNCIHLGRVKGCIVPRQTS